MTDFGVPPGTFPPPPVPPSAGGPVPPFTDRTGPAWEHPGPPAQRFVDTAKAVLLDPQATFRNMRREGGLANPLTYYMIGVVIAAMAGFVWNMALGGLGMGMGMGGLDHMGGGSFGMLIFYPILLLVAFFVASGIFHVLLSVLGAARFPYETTARTVAYAHGSALPLTIVPICGGVIGAVWAVVALIIGLAQTQETSIGKSAAAVLIPGIVCCGVVFLFWATLAAMLGIAAINAS